MGAKHHDQVWVKASALSSSNRSQEEEKPNEFMDRFADILPMAGVMQTLIQSLYTNSFTVYTCKTGPSQAAISDASS